MTANIIDRETGEVIDTIECDRIEGNTAYISAGRGVTTVTFSEEYALEAAESE